MALTKSETAELVKLLQKLEWPLPCSVFHALNGKLVTVPVELAVFDSRGRVLLIYRKDEEYEGYHIPGTVLRDNETVPMALKRLIQSEIKEYIGGCELTEPIQCPWREIPRGKETGQNPTRHEISLMHIAFLRCKHKKKKRKNGGFFRLDPHLKMISHQLGALSLIEKILYLLLAGDTKKFFQDLAVHIDSVRNFL